jgi:hypothetical protein
VDFRSPVWLWLGSLAVPLVVLYILKVRRRPRVVPSTFLWQETLREMEAQAPFRRLRRDWLLLLQILALATLVLSAAGPYWPTFRLSGTRAAIVLDGSASMLAGDRLDLARREAERLIEGLGPRDEAAVVSGGVTALVLAPLTADRGVLREAVSAHRARPMPSDLGGAIELARSLVGVDGEVVLITDVSAQLPDDPQVSVRRVGERSANTGIVALGVRAANPSGRDHQVFVRLRNASSEHRRGVVELRFEDTVRDLSSVDLPPREERGLTLELLGEEEGRVSVRWRPDAAPDWPTDDTAFWWLRQPPVRVYRIRGEADPFLLHALRASDGWRPAASDEPADLEIVVRRTPEANGPPFLWIDPVELRRDVVAGAKLIDWQRAHAALRDVDLHPTRFGRIPSVERPVGATVLARTTAGPLVLEGVRDDRRYLAWAFDPLESDLPLRVSFPLMVHNALEYLAPKSGALAGGVRTGEKPVVPWSANTSVDLVSPSGIVRRLSPVGGRLHLPPLDEIGFWRLSGQGREVAFAASLLDERESDLGRKSDTTVAAIQAPPGPERTLVGRDLWRPVLLVGLIVLLIEGLAFHRRWLT